MREADGGIVLRVARLALLSPFRARNRAVAGEPRSPWFLYAVTQERCDRSAGTHTRSLIDPSRAPARRPVRNEDTSQPEANRIDGAPHAGRCVYLPPRNDAAQSPARSRRGSYSLRTTVAGAKGVLTTTACVSVGAKCVCPTMAHDCTDPRVDVRRDTDVRLDRQAAFAPLSLCGDLTRRVGARSPRAQVQRQSRHAAPPRQSRDEWVSPGLRRLRRAAHTTVTDRSGGCPWTGIR